MAVSHDNLVHRDVDVFELANFPEESRELLVPQDIQQPSHDIGGIVLRFGSISLLKNWLPQVDPPEPHSRSWMRHLSTRGKALLGIFLLSFAVLLINLGVTVYAMSKRNVDQQNFVDILQPNGNYDCDSIRQYNRWMHFAINALSTALLGASNYCAQLLVAPTRKEVDNAHSKKTWLDIGIQSFRNLRKVNPKRRTLWVLLMLSSGLLHLFWNSAVFAATPFSTYNVGLVTADFLDDQTEWNTSLSLLEDIRRAASQLDVISKTDCISRYVGKTSGLASVLVVSANITMSDELSDDVDHPRSSLLTNFTTIEGPGSDWGLNSDWMCSAWALPGLRSSFACTEIFLMPYNKTWTLGNNSGFKVNHCLALDNGKAMDNACALRFSPVILIIVTALNLFKCFCIGSTVYLHWHDSYTPHTSRGMRHKGSSYQNISEQKRNLRHLVTLGDAIASFLDEEDMHTKHMDLFAKRDFVKGWPLPHRNRERTHPRPTYWCRAASTLRWCTTLFLCISLLALVGILLGLTIKAQRALGVQVDLASLWSYGVGDARQWAVTLTGFMRRLNQTSGFFFGVLYANIFQVVVSALYLLYNNLLTVMVAASEWNDFISERKALRLSVPRGMQRSHYFLSLPYRYSVPLMVCSGLLHWLISQSIFVIQTVAYTPNFDRNRNMDASSVGYSSIGIMLAMAVGFVLVFLLLIVGFAFKYDVKRVKRDGFVPPHPMPLVSTCSAAISANCHRHEKDKDCARLPVIWGFVQDEGADSGRYTFTTAKEVGPGALDSRF